MLHRVTLRGAAADIYSARVPVQRALEQNNWPTTRPGEHLFLRRISVSGTPREIAARSAEEARRLACSAVDGWSSAAPAAPAVRFRSTATLLACLIRDLLNGTARHCWYWQRWHDLLQRPTYESIAIILQEAPHALPAVLEQLHATPLWREFWYKLGDSGAGKLLDCIACNSGWSAALQAARALIVRGDPISEATSAVDVAVTPSFDISFLPAAPTDQRPLLAAVVVLWQQAPTVLGRPDGVKQLLRLTGIIAGRSAGEACLERPENSPLPGLDVHHPPTSVEKSVAAQPALTSATTSPSSVSPVCGSIQSPPDIPITSRRKEQLPAEGSRPVSISRQVTVMAEAEDRETVEPETGGCAELPEHTFITDQGGLFYLLNFLNLPMVRAQLPDDQPGAGWHWLYDLATLLGCRPTGYLRDFFAAQCGLKNGAELTLPSAPEQMNQIVMMGAGRYGEEVWQGGSWQLPARLIVTASHVDLHFRLSDAKPAVRRVGLDVNPGWLPWLGRVVTFYYGSGREPEL